MLEEVEKRLQSLGITRRRGAYQSTKYAKFQIFEVFFQNGLGCPHSTHATFQTRTMVRKELKK